MSATYVAFVDYGQIAEPGVIIQESVRETQDGYEVTIYTGELYLDDERFRSTDPLEPSHGDMDRWETVLAEHGWTLAGEWQYGACQYTAVVEPAA